MVTAAIILQTGSVFFLAGSCIVATGILLNTVLEWNIFKNVPAAVILVTPFLGLKGNIEMTLSSRLSTQAHLGNLDRVNTFTLIALGNTTFVQVQAIICGMLASAFALTFQFILSGYVKWDHALLIFAAGGLSAALVSLVMTVLLITVVVIARQCKCDPDILCTPIAAVLGDMLALLTLSFVAESLWSTPKSSRPWLFGMIFASLAVVFFCCCLLIWTNTFVKSFIFTGWTSIVFAVFISSVGGILLDQVGFRYSDFYFYQPIINGVGGNLVSVQASRISSGLNARTEDYARKKKCICIRPWRVFIKGEYASFTRCLIFLVLPGQLLFASLPWLIASAGGGKSYSLIFVGYFVAGSLLQVFVLLSLATSLTTTIWHCGSDPDMSSIPILTAIGDLLGTSILLGVCFLTEISV